MGVLTGLTRTLSRWSWIEKERQTGFADKSRVAAYLVAVLGVEQDPAQLNDFCRVLGHIDTVLVAGGGYVDDKVAVEATAGSGGCRGHSAAKSALAVGDVGSRTLWQKRLKVDESGSGREASTTSRELERWKVSRPDAAPTCASDQVFTT